MMNFLQRLENLDDGMKAYLGVMAFFWSAFLMVILSAGVAPTINALASQSQPTCTEVSK